MRVTILAENLNRALNIVGRSVAVRPQLPILSNVLMRATKDGLELLSTDLEMSFRVKLGAKVEAEGEMGVPAKLLTELLSTFSGGAVELVGEEEKMKIVSGKVKASISATAAGEFPIVPSFKGKADLIFEGAALKESIDRVALSASKDDSRPVFTGILWIIESASVRLVATDGYRLGIDEIKVEKVGEKEFKRVIVPARSLMELMRVMDKDSSGKVEVKMEEDKQQILFKVGGVELVSRLLSGEFPPYQNILPSSHSISAEFDKGELLEAVKRSAIFARESANIIKLKVITDKCLVSANNTQAGNSETEVEALVEGDELLVAFNSRYLLDYLGCVDSEKVTLQSEGSLKPGVWNMGSKTKFTQVIMPVRVQE